MDTSDVPKQYWQWNLGSKLGAPSAATTPFISCRHSTAFLHRASQPFPLLRSRGSVFRTGRSAPVRSSVIQLIDTSLSLCIEAIKLTVKWKRTPMSKCLCNLPPHIGCLEVSLFISTTNTAGSAGRGLALKDGSPVSGDVLMGCNQQNFQKSKNYVVDLGVCADWLRNFLCYVTVMLFVTHTSYHLLLQNPTPQTIN